MTTTGSTTTTELPTSTFIETRTTPPPDHTDPQRDCTNPYSISFDKVDAWEDGFVGLITIPKQALRLDNFGSEYTIIFDMKDENHEIDFETWNVKFYMNYYGTRGWVYHSQPGDEFDNSSFAFVMQNVPSGFSRKLVISVIVKTRSNLAAISILPGIVTDPKCFGDVTTTTAKSITSPDIAACDVELVAGLWSNFPESQSVKLEFLNSWLDYSSKTTSLYSVRIYMGHKVLRKWMLTLDLSQGYT